MKVIVSGYREFTNYKLFSRVLDNIFTAVSGKIELVSGGCRGTDTMAEAYAKQSNLPFSCFPAEWDKYGKRAGRLRNAEMVVYGDMLIAFMHRKAICTGHMLSLAQQHKIQPIYVFNIEKQTLQVRGG